MLHPMVFSHQNHGADILYERLMPSLNPDNHHAKDADWRTPCRGTHWVDVKYVVACVLVTSAVVCVVSRIEMRPILLH